MFYDTGLSRCLRCDELCLKCNVCQEPVRYNSWNGRVSSLGSRTWDSLWELEIWQQQGRGGQDACMCTCTAGVWDVHRTQASDTHACTCGQMDTHPKMSGEHARTARESRMDTHTTCTQNPGVQDEHSRTWVSEMDRRTYTHACFQNRWTIHVRATPVCGSSLSRLEWKGKAAALAIGWSLQVGSWKLLLLPTLTDMWEPRLHLAIWTRIMGAGGG